MSLFNSHDPEIVRILREIAEAEVGQIELLADIRKLAAGIFVVTKEIRDILGTQLHPRPSGLRITQSQPTTGVTIMPITGIQAGGAAGTFTETPTPAGSVFPAGTAFTWTADDPNVVLTPSADGTSTTAQTPATDTATSFNLTCTSSFGTPAIAGTVQVPILPPAVVTPTGLTIDQTA